MKEKKHTPVLDIIIFAVGVALLGICSGCATASRYLGIASNICAAFTATAPSLSPARTSANDSPIESGPYSNSPVVKKGDATGTAGEL